MSDETPRDEFEAFSGVGLRGNRLARLMLVTAIAAIAVTVMSLLSAPASMGGGPPDPSPSWVWLVSGLGVVGVLFGLAWMVRIYRADPEGHPSSWRSKRS